MLRRAIGARPRDFALACLLYSAHQLGESMVPVLIGAAIGQAVATGSAAALGVWLVLLAADFALLSFSYRFGARASARAKQHAGHALRLAVTERALDPAGGADLAPGELLARASSDADRVGAAVGVLASSVAAVAATVVAIVFLMASSPLLGLLIVAGTLALLGVTSAVSRRLAARSAVEQQAAADATVAAADLVRGLRALAGLGAGRAAAERYRATSRTTTRTAIHAIDAQSTISAVAALLTGLYLMVIAGVGGWLALSGGLGLGRLVSALGLAVFVAGPLQTLTGVPASIARATASATRLAEVLNRPRAVVPGVAPAPQSPAPAVAVDGPWVSFEAQAGALTGVVAADPAVASRLAALLAREEEDAEMRVLLDGADTRGIALEALRGRLVVAPHEAAVLDASLRENIAVGGTGMEAAGGAQVAAAATAAFADEIAEARGWDSGAGEGGHRLSGGQRQRLTLARALAADAPALVLHEPTTAVDAATEDLVADRLRALRAGRTTLLLTTSPALLARCDRVVVLEPGGAAGARGAARSGTHDELWREDAAYRELVAR